MTTLVLAAKLFAHQLKKCMIDLLNSVYNYVLGIFKIIIENLFTACECIFLKRFSSDVHKTVELM